MLGQSDARWYPRSSTAIRRFESLPQLALRIGTSNDSRNV